MRSPILVGLVHPLNLAMLGVSVFAGLVSAWWLLPVGVLFWLIMVVAVARDPSLRFSYKMQSRAPLAQRFQHYFDRIERAQLSIFNNLASAPPRIRRVLQPIQAEVDALTAQVHSLCVRMTNLENYRLVSKSKRDFDADRQHIQQILDRTNDPLVGREYADSQRALESRAARLDAVSKLLDRVEAQLLSLANEMDGIVTEVIRLQAIGAKDAARYVPDMVKQLCRQGDELRTFEKDAIEI